MAVVWAFRIAIFLGERGTARIYTATGAGAPGAGALEEYLRHHYLTGDDDDAATSAALSEHFGYPTSVATFTGSFEVRRLQVSFTKSSGDVSGEDVRVITFHLIKATGGTPSDVWDGADFTAARDPLLAMWATLKAWYRPGTVLSRTAFYKAGPGVSPPQPPVNAADHAIPGTSTFANDLPPQVAVSVMERNSGSRKNHGRFFLPAPHGAMAGGDGRIQAGFLTDWADAIDTMYQAWKTAGIPAVVYLPELPERSPTSSDPRYVTKGTLPPRAATARTVDEIVIDDVFDVIRSRRFDRSLNRQARAIS